MSRVVRTAVWLDTTEFNINLTAVVSTVELDVGWSWVAGSRPQVILVRYSSVIVGSAEFSFLLITGFAVATFAPCGGRDPAGIRDMVAVLSMRRKNSVWAEACQCGKSGPWMADR